VLQGSGGLLTNIIGCMQGSGDTDPIFIACIIVRRIPIGIFIERMQGSGRYRSDIHERMQGQADTDRIFIERMQRSGGYRSDIHERMHGSGDSQYSW